jgi:hypothetical protein
MQTKKAQKEFDVIIVGAGLSGLLLAKKAKALGKAFALIEAQDVYGGFHHPTYTFLDSQIDNSLHFLPGSEENQNLITQISIQFELPLEFETRDSQALTYEEGELTPFTGFGKVTPEFFEELVPFLHPKELVLLNKSWNLIAKELADSVSESLFLNHLASKLVIEDQNAVGVIVNGSYFWKAQSVIFSGGITDLQAFLPQSFLSPRLKNHLKRPKLWTLIAVDFHHDREISSRSNLHILDGTTQDDIGPCVGRFLPSIKGNQISQWLSFASDEDADESENIGAIIKKIKRQIKRAYPHAFEGVVSEKIVVIPSGAGYFEDTQIRNGVELKDIKGLYLNSSHLSSQKGVLKPLDQALRVATRLNWTEASAKAQMKNFGVSSPQDLRL